MPNWQIAAAMILVSTCNGDKRAMESVYLDLGHPVKSSLSSGVRVAYDGEDTLNVGKSITRARPPSLMSLSPDRSVWILNYGEGSGQVYSLELHWLDSEQISTDYAFKEGLIKDAHSRGCRISPDQVSVLFDGWDGSGSTFKVRTEDFSRRAGCESVVGQFKVEIDPHGSWKIRQIHTVRHP